MVLWQSPDTLVMSCFHVSVRLRVCSLVCLPCFMLEHGVARSSVLMAVCIHVVMSCVKTWLVSFLISCVFVSCFAHGWWFVCWPCACVFVLCEHVASVLVFCVPCALCQLSWPHPSCFLIIVNFPTCLASITSSFAPFTISLCLQSRASSSSFHHWCYPGGILSCPVCLVLSCLAMSCLSKPCQLSWFSPTG